MSPAPEPLDSPELPETPDRFWFLRSRRLLVIVILLALGVWPAYQGFRQFRTYRFLVACDKAREQHDWRGMRDVALQWARWDPASGPPWWNAAEAAQELDDLEEMARCLGQIPESDPKALFEDVEKANLEWTALNRPLDALETSQRIIRMDPRVLEVHSRVISFYAMTLQRPLMLKAIRSAIEAGAEPKECYTYFVMADALSFTNGPEINSRWLAAMPDEIRFKISLAVNTAMRLLMTEDASRTDEVVEMNKEAMIQLEWFLEKRPHDSVLLTFLMHQSYLAGDIDRVAELLQQVDETSVDDHMVWVYRAWYHATGNEFIEAEKAIQEALRLHPVSPLAHHEYASLLRKMQRPEAEDHQKLAALGREIRTQLLHLPTAVDLTPELLALIANYAAACGDDQVAESLHKRLQPAADFVPYRQ